MRGLPAQGKGGGEAQVAVGPALVLAHQVVPRVESLPGVSGAAGDLAGSVMALAVLFAESV